jgi:hypothetical protein
MLVPTKELSSCNSMQLLCPYYILAGGVCFTFSALDPHKSGQGGTINLPQRKGWVSKGRTDVAIAGIKE